MYKITYFYSLFFNVICVFPYPFSSNFFYFDAHFLFIFLFILNIFRLCIPSTIEELPNFQWGVIQCKEVRLCFDVLFQDLLPRRRKSR